MIKLGIIGTGVIVERFLKTAQKNQAVVVSSIYSRSLAKAENFAKKYHIKQATDNFADMLSEIDAIYIASPNGLHYEQAKYFLEHKIHVLLEKPLTFTVKEAQKLFSIAAKQKVILLEAYITIHLPLLKKLQAKVHQINAQFANLTFNRRSSRMPLVEEGIFNSVFDAQLGLGATYDSLIYPLQLALVLFGAVQSVKAVNRNLANGVALDNYVILEHANGIITTITNSKGWNSFTASEIVGTHGNIVIEQIHPLQRFQVYDNRQQAWTNIIGDEASDLFNYELNDFITMIKTNDQQQFNYFQQYTIMNLQVIAAINADQKEQGVKINDKH